MQVRDSSIETDTRAERSGPIDNLEAAQCGESWIFCLGYRNVRGRLESAATMAIPFVNR